MKNKVKIELPSLISIEKLGLAWKVLPKNGCIVDLNEYISLKSSVLVSDLPKEWLKEVEDWSVSAEESFNEWSKNNASSHASQVFKAGFERGEINNELKHRAKQTADEIWFENESRIDVQGSYAHDIFFEAYKLFEKNRGYDE